jgi:L-ascorbate metabolism protein UlaG (beta-lactamase superfamily)
MKNAICFPVLVFAVLVSLPVANAASAATSNPTQIRWFGHAAFQVTTPSGKILLIDPWITNPSNPSGKEMLAQIEKADFILITHGHSDHVGDAVAIAKKTGAQLVSSVELSTNMVRLLGFPEKQASIMTAGNPGGELKLADGDVTVAFTPAVHSSGLDSNENPPKPVAYGGNPVGFVLMIKNGPVIYHTGDTAYFKDMEVIGTTYHPDLALINIGGHFGMEAPMAAKAAIAVQAKRVVPMHYKTFPILTQDAAPFFKAVSAKKIAHTEMKVGETLRFDGKQLRQ